MDTNQTSSESRLRFLDYWRVIKTRKAILFVVFLLVVLTTFTYTYFQPNFYRSSVRMKVEPERPTVELSGQQPILTPYDPYFLQTQNQIIRSQKVLHPVIEKMKLQEHWGQQFGAQLSLETAFQILKNRVRVMAVPNTSLIEVFVMDEKPSKAADIANEIARIFESERLEVKRDQTMRGVRTLEDEIKLQYAKLKKAQDQVERLRKELNVPNVKVDDLRITQLEQQLTSARIEAGGKATRMDELKKLTPLQLRNTIATIISDPNVQRLLQELTDAELQLEVLKEDYGPDHPRARTAIASRDKLQEQLDGRLEGVMRSFEVDYKIAQQHVDDLQKQLDGAKSVSLTLESDAFRPFRNAQREEDMEIRLYEQLKSRFQQVMVELQVPRSPVEVIDFAVADPRPVEPNLWRNMAIGVIFGLLFGMGMAFFIEFFDTSIKKMEDVERFLGLPVLGVIAQQAGLLIRDEASPSHIEAYRMLRTNIEFAGGERGHKSLAILSGGAGEGKSFTVANLAAVFAQQGNRVLIVDCDMRRPGVHKYFGVSNEIGLAEYLSGARSVEEVIQLTGVQSIFIITSGGGAGKAMLPMLTSQRMRQLIKEVGEKYDVVLYDTPPVLGVSDAAVVASEVGTAILVIQHRRFPRLMAQQSRRAIENAGGRLLGVVVNNVNVSQDETYYYYHHHYDDYLRAPQQGAAVNEAPVKPKSDSEKIDLSNKY